MQSLAVNGYAADAVLSELRAARGARLVRYRYDLLDSSGARKGGLDVKSCTMSMRANAAISRTARLAMAEPASINWLSDMIRPWFCLRMPDGGWAEWPLGTFLLASPGVTAPGSAKVMDVDAYDMGQVLSDDRFGYRYVVAAGTDPVAAAKRIIQDAGIWNISITDSGSPLQADIEFEPNTPRIEAVNTLLKLVNYKALWFDEYGQAKSAVIPQWSALVADQEYRDDAKSVMFDVSSEDDGFAVPNTWRVVCSDAAAGELVGTYKNTSPYSPFSTVNRGRTISRQYTVSGIPSQAEIDKYAMRVAYEDTMSTSTVKFSTPPMPHHQVGDILFVVHTRSGLSALVEETGWSMDLARGGRMQHTCRKVAMI